ncbi:putative aldouronate transport system permease protein [Paenibacillus forsythiae]|uniref:Aldouronate transport system permease protein n=1 Tax=Paenibacillus forsythiae TaxID=365616 RepID=A0ABU3HBS5_9BACL|nr:ABC transporter permease subunit [Paenibacillus forsythiae]MDT3428272.1 putative aldouronate transport system permease protein [Paenibacillus forsythiae]
MDNTIAKDKNSLVIKQKGMRRIRSGVYLRRNIHYYILLILPILYFVVFRYGPIIGNVLAFRKFVPGGSIYGEEWVGLKYFKLFLRDPNFWAAFKNTWLLSFYHLLITVPIAILFALLVNEIKSSKLRSAVQTISYFPNFISIVVVVGLMKELLSPTYGLVNKALGMVGIDPVFFMNEPGWFRALYISSEVWQYTGWNSIIFFAAISSIDPQLYEAAEVDGAGRLKQIIHVTIPQIMPTITVVYILSLGQLMTVAFEKVLLMYTPSNSQVSDVIETFVYRMGLESSNYSYATAVGLFSGFLGLVIVIAANYLSRKVTRYSLY